MITAVALRGVLTLSFEGRTVEVSLEGFRLAEIIEYIERKTGKQINLLAGQLGR